MLHHFAISLKTKELDEYMNQEGTQSCLIPRQFLLPQKGSLI